MEASKGIFALAVDHGEVDVEDAEQTVRDIFGAGGLPVCGPGHAVCDGYLADGGMACEDVGWDAGDGFELDDKTVFGASQVPVLVVELHFLWGEQLL